MSETGSRKVNEIDELIRESGKEGVELLLLFKLLKTEVKQRVGKEYPASIIGEETLNRLCIQKAQQLIKLKKENPGEEDFKELLSSLRRKK
jgi:hypothetical protein